MMTRKITLMNGTQLECYEKNSIPQDIHVIDNSLSLDTSGEYMVIGGRRRKKVRRPLLEDRPEVKLFFENAHFLYEHRDAILHDSRMFLSPIPFNNGLAYFGESGFLHPTLGVYIEWWMTNEEVIIKDEDGISWLVWHLSGSPLSHANNCGLVNALGQIKRQDLRPFFMKVTKNFVAINRRYDDVKLSCEAYKLSELIKKLKN